jgi:Spy/CpxP family protein refolding chaperone
MRRLEMLTVSSLALAVSLPFAAWAADDEAAKREEPATPQAEPAGQRAPGWWNSPQMVETLSLSAEQREKMDAALAAYRRLVTGEGRETLASFHAALAAGDWDAARAGLKQLSERSAVQMQARGDLKLDVLRVLDDEQRALLVERYPGLLRQGWGQAQGGRPRRGR